MKFCNEMVLRQVKLNEANNILHMLLADLNCLDNSTTERARFWLRYKGEIRSVLCTRRTEVSNHIKEVVYNGKCNCFITCITVSYTNTSYRSYAFYNYTGRWITKRAITIIIQQQIITNKSLHNADPTSN